MIPYGYDKTLEAFGKPFVTDVKPGKKFIKRVEKDLPLDSNNLSVALKLYNNLNEVVEYQEEVLAFRQDLSLASSKRIYEMPISSINLTDNQVTCRTWAELYAFFLNKHNIPCVISVSGLHHSVYFKEEGFLFNADATVIDNNESDNYNMSDLTRSKLGLRPNGFGALIQDEEVGAKKVSVYDLGLNLDISTEIDYVNFEDRTNAIVRTLTNCSTFKIHNIPDVTDEIIYNFSIINNLLLEEDLDNVSAISYIHNLIKVLFSKEQQQHLAYVEVTEDKGKKYNYSEVINYNPNEIRENRHDYKMGMPNLEGYNFIYKDGFLVYLTKRKARHVIEESMNLNMNVISNKGESL